MSRSHTDVQVSIAYTAAASNFPPLLCERVPERLCYPTDHWTKHVIVANDLWPNISILVSRTWSWIMMSFLDSGFCCFCLL